VYAEGTIADRMKPLIDGRAPLPGAHFRSMPPLTIPGSDVCICDACGYAVEKLTFQPCDQTECPKCGAPMRREIRTNVSFEDKQQRFKSLLSEARVKVKYDIVDEEAEPEGPPASGEAAEAALQGAEGLKVQKSNYRWVLTYKTDKSNGETQKDLQQRLKGKGFTDFKRGKFHGSTETGLSATFPKGGGVFARIRTKTSQPKGMEKTHSTFVTVEAEHATK